MSSIEKMLAAPFLPLNRIEPEELEHELFVREWIIDQRIKRDPQVWEQIVNDRVERSIENG